MILPFSELKQYPFCLSDIKVILQNPQYREFCARGRTCNGFLYVVSGSCRYDFDGGGFTLTEGGLTYLPFGSHHKLTVTSESIIFYRIDFTLNINGEMALFSKHPLKICDEVTVECAEAIAALEKDYGIGDNSVIKTEKMCVILASLQRSAISAARKRLMPAVRHLQEHAADGVDCSKLAELCFLGTSRFYDLFHDEFGMSPLQYRDRLLLKRAVALLTAGDISVGETAFAVGFESTAYFSRFFKKHTGLSPSEFINKHCEIK